MDEFLSRLTEVQSSCINNKGLVDRLKSEQFSLKQRKSKLLDSMLDGVINKELFDEKVKEIDDSLKQIEYKITAYSNEIREVEECEDRIKKFRRILSENSSVEVFDRSLFESVIQSVIIGGYEDIGMPDPTIITFVYKTGVCDEKQLAERVLRERIVVGGNNEETKSHMPPSVEVFNFEQPYKHFVFNRDENNALRKRLKFTCQVRVAIAM